MNQKRIMKQYLLIAIAGLTLSSCIKDDNQAENNDCYFSMEAKNLNFTETYKLNNNNQYEIISGSGEITGTVKIPYNKAETFSEDIYAEDDMPDKNNGEYDIWEITEINDLRVNLSYDYYDTDFSMDIDYENLEFYFLEGSLEDYNNGNKVTLKLSDVGMDAYKRNSEKELEYIADFFFGEGEKNITMSFDDLTIILSKSELTTIYDDASFTISGIMDEEKCKQLNN